MDEPKSMRQHWFEHVRKTRVRMSKKKKEPVSHRDAMKAASVSWAKEKAKIERAQKRAAKKSAKEAKAT